jgi:uncharacterized protein DUF402
VTVLEVKRRLDGSVRTYPCEAAEIAADRAVLLYRLPGQGRVADLVLPAGTLTVAYYWTERPYNVYHWIAPPEPGCAASRTPPNDPRGAANVANAPSGQTLAYYFNLSGPVRIGPDRLEWEDLEVDVLVTPDGRVQILDEDAVPASAAARLPEIARARERVLADWRDVSADVERASRAVAARA